MALIGKTEWFVKELVREDSSGHDWFHLDRVRKLTLFLMDKEGLPYHPLVEVAALLHDVADEKLNESKQAGELLLNGFIEDLTLTQAEKVQLRSIIESVGFKGGHGIPPSSKEAEIVCDADRLDAIGAIGIARTFAYGGTVGQVMYDPRIESREKMSEITYRNGTTTSIHHFYEKLLKIKDLLHTETAKKIAEERHQLMEHFLQEFFIEWNGNYEKYFS